jgi:hypothetical protein
MVSEKNLEFIFLVFLLAIGIFYIYLATGTQMLGEDEQYYYSMARDFSSGKFPVYDELGRDYPWSYFTSFLSAFFFLLITPSIGILKAISEFFGILTLIFVYFVGKKFNIYYGIFSVFLLFSIQSFTHFMMIAYVEVPIAFFSVLVFYLFLRMKDIKTSVFTGLTLGLAYFTKTSALILPLILIIYAFIRLFYFKDKKYIKLAFISVIVFSLFLSSLVIRNLVLFKYPYTLGLDFFFKPSEHARTEWPKWLVKEFQNVSPVRLSLETYTSTFGLIEFIFLIFGFTYFLFNWKEDKKEREPLILMVLFSLLFIIVFNFYLISSFIPIESRYLSMIFPQISLLEGLFLWKLKEWNKVFLILILPILLFSLYSSITTATGTYNSQRYPSDYLEALKWVKTNTPKDSFIFTTYVGSLKYFGERNGIWANDIDEYFPEIMTTDNSTFIYEILKKYNVSYILIWRSTLAQNYIIPESNIWGVFTYKFAQVISNDTISFDNVFSNQNNWIFKLK